MGMASNIHHRAVKTVTPKVMAATSDSPPAKPESQAATPSKGASQDITFDTLMASSSTPLHVARQPTPPPRLAKDFLTRLR